jgi:ABC-type branched-subunit amino acid transport system substrate-binding protein
LPTAVSVWTDAKYAFLQEILAMKTQLRTASFGFAVAALLSSTAGWAQTVVRIGHVAPMTGGIAHLGKDNENGAKLAIADLNKAGLTIGGQKVMFELLSEDDAHHGTHHKHLTVGEVNELQDAIDHGVA